MNQPPDDPTRAQRAIVRQLLRMDQREAWSLSRLYFMVTEVTPEAVKDGIMRLEAGGVVYYLDEFVGVSRCVKHLNALGLIDG